MPQWLKTALTHLGAILLIFTIVGAIAKPHAQGFIEDTVNERIGQLERQMDEVQSSIDAQQREQAVIQNDISNIKKSQEDTKFNTRMIFQSLQGLRQEITE